MEEVSESWVSSDEDEPEPSSQERTFGPSPFAKKPTRSAKATFNPQTRKRLDFSSPMPKKAAAAQSQVEIMEEEEEEEEEEASLPSRPITTKKSPPKKQTTAVPPAPVAVVASSNEEKAVRQMAHVMGDIVMRALHPMWDAVCGLAWKLGYRDARYFLVWRDPKKEPTNDPFSYLRVIDENDPQLTSMSYFLAKYGPLLGQRFLTLFLGNYQKGESQAAKETIEKLSKSPKKMGACFDVDIDLADLNAPHLHRRFAGPDALADLKRRLQTLSDQVDRDAVQQHIDRLEAGNEALRLLKMQEGESQFAPAWAFQVLSDNVFRTFVSPAGLAAFEMALAHVRRIPGCSSFEMKELICSEEVKDQFIWLAAYQYMDASKGLPMDRPAAGKGERSVYVNYNALRETLQRRCYLCTIWFESVVAIPNPLLDKFKAYKAGLGRLTEDQLETLNTYEAALPRRELKYGGC